ncbi:hypothetical protein Taro_052531 [Colocasia esculenta]|uniref:Uncharacterized protein n=1 Tax=Colocasia esculenta TaxID=4460 RepID=A0A843XIX6_COLES|nr:hypothetical protein [Colocasia esculenta]
MLNFWRRYMFTRPEDLPRARVVWEFTAQTNFRKSMWEARTGQRRSQAVRILRLGWITAWRSMTGRGRIAM